MCAALSSDASGETDWARELSSAIVRVGAGVFMVHNGLDKLVDPEGRSSLRFGNAFKWKMEGLEAIDVGSSSLGPYY